jgi:predicted urease superfamily metal-dependent hydrolase
VTAKWVCTPVEVVEFSRKHTANVCDALCAIRRIIEDIARKRDERRDGFAKAIQKAMETKVGDDADEVLKVLAQKTIPRSLEKKALEIAQEQGRFTVFALVDALTRLCRDIENAGERMEADQKVAKLLELAV